LTSALKRLVNHAAVREAFHGQGARVPRGFLDEVEQTVYVLLRRAAAGEIDPHIAVDGPCGFLKQSLLKDALREAFGKPRVDTAWVAHMNAVVSSKISDASVRSGAKAGNGPKAHGVPGRIVQAFLRSPESKSMTLSTFYRRWQDAAFRDEWIARAGRRRETQSTEAGQTSG